MMKRIAILVFAAACGSKSPAPVDPTAGSGSATAPVAGATCKPPVAPGVIGIADITIKDNGKEMLAVRANGDVQINDPTWKTIGKLDSTGKFVTADGQTGQLGADGTFSTPEGPAPFKLDGAALVAGPNRITIENGKIVGGDGASSLEIDCANDDSTKRAALLLLGLLSSTQSQSAAPSATETPAATPPSPAPPKK